LIQKVISIVKEASKTELSDDEKSEMKSIAQIQEQMANSAFEYELKRLSVKEQILKWNYRVWTLIILR